MDRADATAVETAAGRRNRWRTEHLRAGWPHVHIDFVESEPRAHGCRVRAVIDLGALAPADVRVGLGPADAAGTEPCAAHRSDGRMWSTQRYANGRVVFERVVPTREDKAVREWIVCVHPALELPERPVVYPLRVEAADASRSPPA